MKKGSRDRGHKGYETGCVISLLWFGLLGAAGTMGVSMARAQLAIPPAPFTTFEQAIATRCELLYGENARPNVLFLSSAQGIAEVWNWIVPNLAKINDNGFGPIVLFKGKDYVNGDKPTGIPPVNGRLEFVDPEAVKAAAAFLDEIGHPFLFYLSPGVCHDPRVGNMSSQEIVDDILRVCKELGFKGVYLDGLTCGDNLEETIAALARLKGHGILIMGHMSIHPNLANGGLEYGPGTIRGGQVDWAVPRLLQQLDWALWGETNKVGKTPEEVIVVLRRKSHVALAPAMIPFFKPLKGSPFDSGGASQDHGPVLVELLFAERTYPSQWWQIEPYRTAWKDACAKYRENPRAFVREIAREW